MIKSFVYLLLILNLLWSIGLYFEPTHTTSLNYLYNLSYGLNFLIAMIVSISHLSRDPAHRLVHVLLASASAFFFLAQLIWMAYNLILHTAVPYPGWADLFWLLFYLFSSTAGFSIMRALSIKVTFGKIVEMMITFGVMFMIIYSFINLNASPADLPWLTKAFNISYPFFDTLLITMTLFLIRSPEGRTQTQLLYFMFSFIALGFADTFFAYQTSLETYWNGNFIDATYAVAGFLFVLGVIGLPSLLNQSTKEIEVISAGR